MSEFAGWALLGAGALGIAFYAGMLAMYRICRRHARALDEDVRRELGLAE